MTTRLFRDGRSWSDAERRLLRFAEGAPERRDDADRVRRLEAALSAEKEKSAGLERRVDEMGARVDALQRTLQRVPEARSAPGRTPDVRDAARGAVEHVVTRIDPAPRRGYVLRKVDNVIYRAVPGSPRDTWEYMTTLAEVRDELQRERTARHAWLREERTKSRYSPNLPVGPVTADEFLGRTFDSLDRRWEAGRPGFRSPSEGHFAAQAFYAARRGDYARVESNHSLYIDRTGSDRAHYAKFGGDPLDARDGYYGVGSGRYGPRGPGGPAAYPPGYDRRGKIDPADYGVRGGDVSWADRGGADYASYEYPSRFAPAMPGADMQRYMRTQSRLRESYADDIEWEFMDDLHNGALDAELGNDPGYKSLKLAIMRAESQWKQNPSRRYGDLAILRSQIAEMRRRASQRGQQRSFIEKMKTDAAHSSIPATEKSPSDLPVPEPEVQGGFRSYDVNPQSLFFNRGEKVTIVIPADVLGTQRDYAVSYDPGVWNGDLSDEQFAALKRGGVAIERHESDTATYAQGLSRVPKVEKLTVYFAKSGTFVLNGASVDIPRNPKFEGPVPGRANAMPPRRRGNVPGSYSPSAPRPNQPGVPAPEPSPPSSPSPGPSPRPAPAPRVTPERSPSVTDATIDAWVKANEGLLLLGRILLPPSETAFKQLQTQGIVDAKAKHDALADTKVTLNGAEWIVGSARSVGSEFYVLRLASDPATVVLMEETTEPTRAKLEAAARRALAARESERADAAGVKSFDVAGDKERIGYVELFDGADKVTRELQKGNALMPSILGRRYDVDPSWKSIDYSKGSNDAFVASLRDLYAKGIRNFYVDVIAHGSTLGAGFGTRQLSPADVAAIVQAFPDCRFTLNVMSCHGAGMDVMMRHFRDVPKAAPGRVTVFTQTKLDVPNFATTVEKNHSSTTAYNVALAKYLLQGVGGRPGQRLTYGEAHLKADIDAKIAEKTDAEAMRSGMGKTAGTGRAENAGDLA
jgi:hypothetical protein